MVALKFTVQITSTPAYYFKFYLAKTKRIRKLRKLKSINLTELIYLYTLKQLD